MTRTYRQTKECGAQCDLGRTVCTRPPLLSIHQELTSETMIEAKLDNISLHKVNVPVQVTNKLIFNFFFFKEGYRL